MNRILALVLLSCAVSASAERYYPKDWNDWSDCMMLAGKAVDCGPEPDAPPTPAKPPAPAKPAPPPPTAAEQLKNKAWTAYSSKNYDEAIRLSSESIKLDPSLWESFHFRAWSLYFKGKYGPAANDHAKTVEIGSKTDPYLSFAVAICKSLGGSQQQALEWAGRSLGVDPKFAMALTQMGYSYWELGQLDTAKEKFLAALASDAKRADAHLGLALVEQKKGNLADAKKRLADAKALAPDLNAIDIWMNAKRKFTAKQKTAIAALEGTKAG